MARREHGGSTGQLGDGAEAARRRFGDGSEAARRLGAQLFAGKYALCRMWERDAMGLNMPDMP
ncbi:MAG: hypothetical protein LBJ10_06285, partial [Clostridiales bacterium]|nr:hypothetical protein [Clostridiales bacterium]